VRGRPVQFEEVDFERRIQSGTIPVLGLFLITIIFTVAVHTFLDLPPALGMMGGLSLLKGYSYLFNHRHQPSTVDELDDVFAEPQLEPEIQSRDVVENAAYWLPPSAGGGGANAVATASPPTTSAAMIPPRPAARPMDIMALLEKIEWDTLLFFYGVLLGVGGLGALGYLALTSQMVYGQLGATTANVLVGLLSSLVDNVPVMFAVLQMAPEMSRGDWLLVTLTTGVGGSLFSIGSAAGVALMGQARGIYTFGAHLRWSWAVALGFVGSIGVHLVMQNVLHVWG
jgi:hypothetical protein